jgi:lipoyl(octanoyl) transferase
MQREVRLHTPGLVPYNDAWLWQQHAVAAVLEGETEALAILQHPPVYTLGRRAQEDSLLRDREALAEIGAEVIDSDRGGDVTFHGPGQLVAYPILNLRTRGIGAVDYVRLLEETMLRTVASFGIAAHRVPSRPGIWLQTRRDYASPFNSAVKLPSFSARLPAGRGAHGIEGEVAKLGAVGVRVQRGVSMHGLALNVDVDLSWYDAIVPCGLAGVRVTSMSEALGRRVDVVLAEEAMIEAFVTVFDLSLQPARTPLSLTLSPEGRGDVAAVPVEVGRGR